MNINTIISVVKFWFLEFENGGGKKDVYSDQQ